MSNIKKNTIYNTIKSIFSIAFPIITFPYISRVLGAESIGKVNFGNSVISYFSLIATLGINTYAIRECSKIKNNQEKLKRIASEIYSLNCITTLIAYILLGVTLFVCKPLNSYRTLIIIQSLTIIFATLGAEWINTAFEEFKYITIRTVSIQLISIVLMLAFVHEPNDYLNYAIICVAAASGANIVNFFYRKRFCKIGFIWKMNVKKHLKPVLLLFSLILTQTVYCNSDITILGLIRGDLEVGLYSTSVRIYNIVNTTVASITWVVMPKLSLGFAQKNYKLVNENLRYALCFIMTLGLPCLVGINAITPQIIECVAGKEYLGAVWSLRILTLSLLASFIGGFIGNLMMLPAGREDICLKSAVVSMLLNVGLNICLIPIWGLNAAAATTALAEIVGILIKYPFIAKEIHICNLREIFRGPVIGCAGIAIIAIIMKQITGNIWIICCGTIGFSAIWYIFILLILENEFAMGFFRKIVRK